MSIPTDFKPGDVDVFRTFPPLVGTFDKAEDDAQVAIVVRALTARGNTWRPISVSEVGDVVCSDIADKTSNPYAKLVRDLVENPFLGCQTPQYASLFKRGYMRELPEDCVEFTPGGLAKLQRWAVASGGLARRLEIGITAQQVGPEQGPVDSSLIEMLRRELSSLGNVVPRGAIEERVQAIAHALAWGFHVEERVRTGT